MTQPLTQHIHSAYRRDLAHAHVVAISQHHRIQASPGYRAAAAYVATQVAAAGLDVMIRSYPADGRARFWGAPSFLEWDCREATLDLLDDRDAPVERLCDFAAVPTSLIQRSAAAAGDFELVALPAAWDKEAGDAAVIEVAGKLVLTDRPVAQVYQKAVSVLGAAGILFDGMSMGGRSALDLPDARQYTSFWWAGGTPPNGWGFVLSPRQGKRLRDRLAAGEKLRVRAAISARFYPGAFEVVEAWLPGSDPSGDEVLLVSHLCHPKPGAHDNASGAAALIECAATLSRMLVTGDAPPLRRGIRFIWPPEMTGTYAWLAANEADIARGRWIAGLNLDMVGADQCQTGSTWQLVDLPLASASFADHLLAWLRSPLLAGQRHEETAFSGGSDHYILSDPTVGIPSPMLIQWPDRFYHTSADTPDRVNPDSLGRSGALAASYAHWLATAGPAEARWLGALMVSRFAASGDRALLETLKAVSDAEPEDREHISRAYLHRATLRASTMQSALGTLKRLDPDCDAHMRGLTARVAAIHAEQQAALETDALGHAGAGEPLTLPDQETAPAGAGRLVPVRLVRGPIEVHMALQADAPGRVAELWQLQEEAGHDFYDRAALLQYWADGDRTIAEIAALVAQETGTELQPELALRYFRLLEATGCLSLERAADGRG